MHALLSHRRVASGVLAMLALSGAVAGCGGSDEPQASKGDGAGAVASKATAADVDAAFVRQMIPHHEMAVEMAQVARQKADHGEVKTLAKAIVASQGKEIAELKAAARRLDVKLPAASAGGGHSASMDADAATLGLAMDDMGMSMDMDGLSDAKPFDKAFIAQMTPHHEGAIAMAEAQLARGQDEELETIAKAIVEAQRTELAEMNTWNAEWYGDDAAPKKSGGKHSVH